MHEPRILLADIETLPNVVTSWGLNVPSKYLSHENILSERSIVCASWKWLGKAKVYSADVLDSPGKHRDGGILRKLSGAWSQADAIVAHNGDRFDVPWIKTRMIYAGMEPPPPVPTIDTRSLARRHFYFNSNRLDYLGKYLGVGQKIRTDFHLWLDAMKGRREAIAKMVAYNREDVRLLERVYLKLRPFLPAKVNASQWSTAELACPKCGSDKIHARGLMRLAASTRQRFQCQTCGGWSSKPANSKVIR